MMERLRTQMRPEGPLGMDESFMVPTWDGRRSGLGRGHISQQPARSPEGVARAL